MSFPSVLTPRRERGAVTCRKKDWSVDLYLHSLNQAGSVTLTADYLRASRKPWEQPECPPRCRGCCHLLRTFQREGGGKAKSSWEHVLGEGVCHAGHSGCRVWWDPKGQVPMRWLKKVPHILPGSPLTSPLSPAPGSPSWPADCFLLSLVREAAFPLRPLCLPPHPGTDMHGAGKENPSQACVCRCTSPWAQSECSGAAYTSSSRTKTLSLQLPGASPTDSTQLRPTLGNALN